MGLIDSILEDKRKDHLVIAAAGTGKTETLLNLLATKLSKGLLDPSEQKIVVFTFTNNAADELKVRLVNAIGDDSNLINSIFVGTIHAWCKNYHETNGHMANSKVMDELEVSQLLFRIYSLLGINETYEGTTIFRKIEKFQSDLEIFYNENFEIESDVIPDNVRNVIRNYLNFIDTQRLIDFGYMIRKTINLLKENDKNEEYHLFVDEYQDINKSQVDLFKTMLIKNAKSSLFAVGDPRQAIYQWRGGDVNRILNFQSDFPKSSIHYLDENHRSRPGIINFANLVSSKISFADGIEFHDMEKDQNRLDNRTSVFVIEGESEAEKAIVNEIRRLHDSGIQYSDIAILLRSVSGQGKELMRQLDDNNIPYYSPNKNSGISFVKNVMFSIISLMEIFQQDGHFQNAMEEEETYDSIDKLSRNIMAYTLQKSLQIIQEAVSRWFKELTTPYGYTKKNKPLFRNEAYNFRRQFFDFCESVELRIDEDQYEVQEGFAAVTQIMRGIEEIYRRRFNGITIPRIEPYEVLSKNLKWQLENQLERWSEVGIGFNGGNRVTLSTVHASKGLQWPIVFTSYINDGKFPLRESFDRTSFPDHISMRYGTTMEDERRLWYVCITRARDRLYIVPKTGLRPSTFLAEVKDKMLEGVAYVDVFAKLEDIDLSEVINFPRKSYNTFGVSDILMLVECPLQFHFRKYAGIDVPVGEQFGAGNIIHETIRNVVSESDPKLIPTIVEKQTYLPLAESFTEERVLKSTLKKVENLFNSGILENVDLTEYKFAINFDEFIIQGIIDATLKDNTGITLIDWKSSIHPEFLVRYKRQIRLYAWGMRLLGHNVNNGYIYDLAGKDGNNQLCVDISDKFIESLTNKMKTNYVALKSQENIATPNDVSCKLCDTFKICLYRVGTGSSTAGEESE